MGPRTMTITSDRCYRFDVSPVDLWARITTVEDYRDWWPWLRRFDGRSFMVGDRWAATVQPPLPYTLHLTVQLVEVTAPTCVVAIVGGDVVGTARLEIEPDRRANGCQARLVSTLAPGNRYLRAVAVMARPVVRFGHDWVLDTGARQFRRRITATD